MGSEIFFVLAVFVAVYVGMALGRWLWLRMGTGWGSGFWGLSALVAIGDPVEFKAALTSDNILVLFYIMGARFALAVGGHGETLSLSRRCPYEAHNMPMKCLDRAYELRRSRPERRRRIGIARLSKSMT